MKTINVAVDFSPCPWVRYRKSGEHSGEQFREEVLIPALKNHSAVTIELDGTRGYGSSFLEEAFGGAVRAGCLIDRQRLNLITQDETLDKEIWEYIDDEMSKISLR